jgi:simple sugar transport system permease protein
MVTLATTLKLDQTVIGMTLNLFASGLTVFWYTIAFKVGGAQSYPSIATAEVVKIPFLSKIPFIGEVFFSQKLLTYFAFLLVPAIWYLLYRTWLGLEIRSLGEYPRAVDMRGLHVNRLQYFSVLFGGMLVGLAGSFLTLGSSDLFIPNMSAGRGWLAIVIIIAGNWQPYRILLVTLIFAFLDALQLQIQGVGVQFPYQFLLALPYIFAILVMMSSRARSNAPGWLSTPYNRED